jgi:hypothetical protein
LVVPDARLNVEDQFDVSILESRRSSLERLERLAGQASGFVSRPVGDWSGSIPVSVVTTIDAVRAGVNGSTVTTSDVFSGDEKQLLEALERSSVSVENLQSSDVDTLVNELNKATGAAFELDVQESIRAGELAVPPGTTRVELVSFTNPGADFRFLDADGNTIDLMNTKASLGHEVIARHFAEHPDVRYVFATHEAAESAAQAGFEVVDGLGGSLPVSEGPLVVDTGKSAQEFRDAFQEFVTDGDGGVLDSSDVVGIIEYLPFFTVGYVAYRAYRRHKRGMPLAQKKVALLRDSIRSGSAYAVAVGLQSVGVPIPVILTGAMLSASAINGVFQVRDEWGAIAIQEHALASRLEHLSRSAAV